MPSACAKSENKTSTEVENSSKQCVNVVEKKVRNLEKKKGKLDAYKEKQAGGDKLNEDQLDAVSRYDGVLQQLELARELHKQFQQISNDVDKQLRKKGKRDRLERQDHETQRIRSLLRVQSLLDSMGSEVVREDFQTGRNGAIQLSDENLNQLDELYKLISPTRDEENDFTQQLSEAAEHIANLLDCKEKEVSGTTYKDLQELIDRVESCGYFDKARPTTENAEAVTAEAEKSSAQTELSSTVHTDQHTPDPLSAELAEDPEPAPATATSQVVEEPETLPVMMAAAPAPAAPATAPAPAPASTAVPASTRPAAAVDTPAAEPATEDLGFGFQRVRPFNEIVSSVQGSFNFLQDSEIDLDSPHQVDPAVLASRPMVPGSSYTQQQTAQSGYQGSTMLSNDDQSSAQYQTTQVAGLASQDATSDGLEAAMAAAAAVGVTPDPVVVSQSASLPHGALPIQFGATADNNSIQFGGTDTGMLEQASQQGAPPSAAASGYSAVSETGGYGQQGYGQTLAAAAASSHATTPQQQQQQQLAGAGISFGAEMTSSLEQQQQQQQQQQTDVPQPIPMPSQALMGQSLIGQFDASDPNATQQGKKQFTMNPNADPFQSMYEASGAAVSLGQQAGGPPHSTPPATSPAMAGPHDPAAKVYGQEAAGAAMQGSGYGGSGGYGGRGAGAPQRGGGRGGRVGRGGGGMSNGFPRGASNRAGGPAYGGGSGRGGGSANGGGGGGGYQNGQRSGRGGNNYQGYPARSDYRPEGYQGYGNTGSFGAPSGGQQGYKGAGGATRGTGGNSGGNGGGHGGRGGGRWLKKRTRSLSAPGAPNCPQCSLAWGLISLWGLPPAYRGGLLPSSQSYLNAMLVPTTLGYWGRDGFSSSSSSQGREDARSLCIKEI